MRSRSGSWWPTPTARWWCTTESPSGRPGRGRVTCSSTKRRDALLSEAIAGVSSERTLDALRSAPADGLGPCLADCRRRGRRAGRDRRHLRAHPHRRRANRLRDEHQPRTEDSGRCTHPPGRDPRRRRRPRRRPPAVGEGHVRGRPALADDRRSARAVADRTRGRSGQRSHHREAHRRRGRAANRAIGPTARHRRPDRRAVARAHHLR